MAKKKFDREILESKETLPTVETNAPAGRMQSKQQVAATMDATAVDPGSQPGLSIHSQDVPAQVTRTTKVAEVIKEAKGAYAGGSGSSGTAAMRAGSYSGTTPVMGDMSGSTQLGAADRSTTRTGKKLDSTAKHINYLYNEQVAVKYDESKPLAENPEATQGYNGTYRNEHARTQKKSGFVPADLYYDRSVDEIIADNIYPVMGQTVNDPCADQVIDSFEGGGDNGGYVAKPYHRGNYLGKAMTIAFDSDGHLKKMTFADRDISVKGASVDVANVSAVNGIIDANVAELDRQRMDEKAGDELMPNWNPLPRSIKNPTATIGLLRDIEAMVGSEVFMAYRKTANFFSYQLNKAAKDGQKLYSPIGDMVMGCMDGTAINDATVVGSTGDAKINYLGVKSQYLAGSPALMVELYDSPSKYNTKADFLLQPRGWRMHLQTADNNMNMFRVPEKFAQSVYSNECFSTIDKDYDPFLPVCITDKAALAHPLSFSSFVGTKDGKVVSVPFKYKYANGSNNVYVMNVHHPIVEGLIQYFESMGTKFVKVCGTDDITIPMVHSTLSASLWSLLLLAATPFIMKSRLTSFIDVFDYEESTGEYPFSQLKPIKELDPKYAINYTGSDYNEPLVCGKMKPATAFKWVLPETYWVCREYSDEYDIVMPWYHCGQSYEVDDGKKLSYVPDGAVMCYPSVRSGTRFGFLDTIYGMSEREVRLALDRQTVIPGLGKAYSQYSTGLGELSIHGDEKVEYKYGLATDGQIVANFEADGDQCLTLFDILSTPREIGWVIPAPNGVLTQMVTEFDGPNDYETGYADLDADFGNGATGCNGLFRIRYWQGTSEGVDGVNKPASINVNRAMSLQQDYKVIINQRMVGNYRDYCAHDFIVSLSSMFDATAANPATVNDNSLFKPFTNDGVAATENDRKQVSLQKYFWTRIQRLPFALNPFDCCPSAKSAGADNVPADPYDFLYIFGCAGFRASDYNEDSFNREKYRLNLGMLFVNDPYYDDSSLYRV